MNKIVLILNLLFCLVATNAQTKDTIANTAVVENNATDEGTIICSFKSLSVASEFPGGMNAFYTLFTKNIKKRHLIKAAKCNTHVTFIVEKDGSMTNIEIVGEPNPEIREEILKALAIRTKWTPAIENGKPVITTFNLPIVQAPDK